MTEPLFVYGTLRPGAPEAVRVGGISRAEPARARGRLYALAAGYPALVEPSGGEEVGWVYGWLLELEVPVNWSALDAYEDCDPSHPERSLYLRRWLPVEVAGCWRRAWCYCMPPDRPPLRPGAGARRLPGGRWSPDGGGE